MHAALAVEADINSAQQRKVNSWLIEERIDPEEEGRWRKFINNDSPVPLHMQTESDVERGEFLAFSQHYQYLWSGKLAFVSDYQGE